MEQARVRYLQQARHEEIETAAWVAAAACIAVESLAGIMYMFGLYSPILKSEYALSQTELDGLATATNVANNVGLWLGSGIDRLGPRTMLVAGGGCGKCKCLRFGRAEVAYGSS